MIAGVFKDKILLCHNSSNRNLLVIFINFAYLYNYIKNTFPCTSCFSTETIVRKVDNRIMPCLNIWQRKTPWKNRNPWGGYYTWQMRVISFLSRALGTDRREADSRWFSLYDRLTVFDVSLDRLEGCPDVVAGLTIAMWSRRYFGRWQKVPKGGKY